VLAGGSFTQLGAFAAQGGLSRLSVATGAIDNAFVGDAAGRGSIASFAFDAAGGVILGGSFDAARQDGETTLYPRKNMVRLEPGTFELDRVWAVNVVGEVIAVAIDTGNLFIGGNFTSVQGTARTRLAKLNATTGAIDATWAPTADAPVRNLVPDGNGQLYATGDFITLGGAARDGLGRLATTGAGAVAAWNPAPDDIVDPVLVSASGIYVGGAFGNVGGQNRAALARLSPTTGLADAFSADADANGAVHALAETNDGLYVGGNFITLGGQSRMGVARVAAGAVDGWDPNVAGGDVHSFGIDDANGIVYFGGLFASAGGASHPNLARASVAVPGTVQAAWRPGTDGPVVQIAVTGSDVLVAGAFSLATNEMRNGVAKFGPVGSDLSQIVIDSVTPVGGGTNTVFGQSYVVGWTVTDLTDAGTTPTGTVVVTASTGETCGPVAASNGGCTLTPATTGARTLTAVFTGDPLFLDATSAPFAHTVVPASITLGVSTTPNPSTLGNTADAVITVAVQAPGAPNPAGTVTVTVNNGPGCSIVLPDLDCTLPVFGAFGYYDIAATYTDAASPAHHMATPATSRHAVGTVTTLDLTVPATATVGNAITASVVTTAIPDGSTISVTGGGGCSIVVNANAGSCQLTFNAGGTQQVTATYAGTGALLPASDTATVGVDTIAGTLDIAINPASPFATQAATIDIVATNLPNGAVVNISGAPGCTSIVLPATSCGTSFPAAGPVTVTANFAGNATHGPVGDSANATVQLNATTLDVALAPAAPVVGQTVTVTLTTNLPSGTAVAITGAPGCTQIVLPATGCTTSYAAPGLATVTATFGGNGAFGAANDSASVTIGKASTTFSEFVATPMIGVPGDSITFVWDVDVVAPGAATPTGNVRVSVNGNGTPPSCVAAVAAGTCSIVFPNEGSFTMRAEYLGDANLLTSLSGPTSVNIQQAAPTDSDLMIQKVVSRSRLDRANAIELVEYMIVVGNAGPAAVIGAPVSDTLPAGLANATWTCASNGGGSSCSALGGSGNITSLTATLPANTTVTVTVQATVSAGAPPRIFNTATVAAPAGANDPSPANNSSTVLYQACPSSAGAALVQHFCMFRDGFEN
jgi:uncharacterized repeat protein (TIGR01451 family)